ncbi:MAG TPA: hypothetical protein PKC91_04845 [Ignavibacteria bacterium]|nr:hypothetical protein [Ignavibacteria bacterium]
MICKYILLLVILLNFSKLTFAQSKEEIIERIREEIESIHLDTALKSVTLQNEEFLENMTDGGGELTGFYKGKSINRIYRSIGISFGVGISEFYYKKNRLIFIREKFNSYVYDDSLGTADYTKLNTTYSAKHYFDNGRLIESSSTGHKITSGETQDTEKILLDESDEAFNFINKIILSLSGRGK